MGVTGLLQNLAEIQEPTTLEKYRGKTLAIDTYGWLHRGLISCAQELCQDLPTRKYITSILKKVDMLRHFGVEPYFVFDGAPLPTKAETANERRLRREEARKKADEFFNRGDKKTAWKEYMKAASVTSEMAKSVMTELDQRNIKYIVAPYEADPQMVYLEKIGIVDGILSEDSDLLIFGCNRLITKLKDDSSCIEICRENFSKVKKIPGLFNFTQEQLRLVAMLSGCDYTKGIANIGLKTAFTLVKKYDNLEKVLLALRSEGKFPSEDFLEEVKLANLAFQFQKVYHPIENELRTLNDYPEELEFDNETLENCCGKTYDNDLYYKLCNGYIHPFTHDVLVSREQNLTSLKSNSMNFKSTTNTMFSTNRSKSTLSDKTIYSITRNRSIVSMTNTRGTIDNFFKKGTMKTDNTQMKRKCFESTLSNKEKCHKPNLSPTSKKIMKLEIKEETETCNRKSSFFLKPDQNIKNPTPKLETQVYDYSLISGDSDIDDFSSPLKQVKSSILEKNIDEKINKSSIDPNKEETIKLDLSNYKSSDIDELDDEIEESPTKVKLDPEMQTNFTKFAKILRANFSYDPTKKVAPPNRIPFGKVDFNKNKNKTNQKQKITDTNTNINTKSHLHSNFQTQTVQNNNPKLLDKPKIPVISSPNNLNKTVNIIKPRVSLKNFAYKG